MDSVFEKIVSIMYIEYKKIANEQPMTIQF
jgi:hypothetical protein